MSRQSYVASTVATKRSDVILSGPPLPDAASHDEWHLDEALVEIFSASNPIAVSPCSRTSAELAWRPSAGVSLVFPQCTKTTEEGVIWRPARFQIATSAMAKLLK